MADERENAGMNEWPTDEGGSSGGTEGGLGTDGSGSDTDLGADTDMGSDAGRGYETGVGTGDTGGESWTDPGSEDITRHSGP